MKQTPTLLIIVAVALTVQSRSAAAETPASFALQAGPGSQKSPAALADSGGAPSQAKPHGADGRYAALEIQLGYGSPGGGLALGPVLALNRFLSVEATAGLNLSGFQASGMARARLVRGGGGLSVAAGLSIGNHTDDPISLFASKQTSYERVVWRNVEAAFHVPWGASQLRVAVGRRGAMSARGCRYERSGGSWDHPESDSGDCSGDSLPDARNYVTVGWSTPIAF